MLEIQQRWAAQLDFDLQQHGECLHLHSAAGAVPLGSVCLDCLPPPAGHPPVLWSNIQVPDVQCEVCTDSAAVLQACSAQ